MTFESILVNVLYLCGSVLFFCGVLGYLRFPDLYTKMHAATKADNIGLVFILIGAGIELGDPALIPKLILIWFAMLFGGGISSNLLSHMGQRQHIDPVIYDSPKKQKEPHDD